VSTPLPTQPTSSFFEFVKRLAEISVLLGGLLFLIGWSYQYGYYSGFGLSSDDLGFSTYDVVVHSLPVISETWFLVVTMLVFLTLALATRIGHAKRLLTDLTVTIILCVVGIVSASRYALNLGRKYSYRDSVLTTTKLPFVTLEGSTEDQGTGCSFNEANYHLLLRSNGHVFVILPIDKPVGDNLANLRVCSFLDSKVQNLRIQVGLSER
jgi:hypothetical protein